MVKVIDLRKTGENIKRLCENNNVTVSDLQREMHFNNPQSIYKWFHGESLPSVDNLCLLAIKLRVPIEALIVFNDDTLSESHMGDMIKWLGEKAVDSKLLRNTFANVISVLIKRDNN